MDLLAAEPLVASPVAMAYDENGSAFVCEMRDYPYTDKARHQRNQENPSDDAIGTLRLLRDADGDGVFDESSVFAEGLSWPTGVACWKGGVFVASTPDIWYLKDTDGDGKADLRRRVFTGFRKLNVQAVMNSLVWGLDNLIHGAGGSNGGQIRPGGQPAASPLVMGRHDFRFDPVTERFETRSGGARFGGTFDDWGRRFLCDIRNPAQHVVLPLHYLERNPFLPVRGVLHDMAESGDQLPLHRISPPEHWRVVRAKRWAGERDIVMPRSELVGAGVVTSASGITSYRGAAYPEKYRGNVFVCECAGNLFYRLEVRPDGATFRAARVDGRAEMVASTDNWFRPVNFVNAPDGTLHVLDMYRENIEHPWSIPDDIHAAVDLESGRERGRIWRLTPPDFKPQDRPRLGHATVSELVAALENPNSWWRETAQRLLVERQDHSSVPALRSLLGRSRTPQARLHALWTLAGLNRLSDEDLLAGLLDPTAGVRENAVLLAEPRAAIQPVDGAGSGSPRVRESLFKLSRDEDPRVRFQLAFTLGQIHSPRAEEALAGIAKRDAGDPWIRAAVLSSVATRSDLLLVRLREDPALAGQAKAIVRELAQVVGARGRPEEIQRALAITNSNGEDPDPCWLEAVRGVGEGLKRSGVSLRRAGLNLESRQAIDRLLSKAVQMSTNFLAPSEVRIDSIRLLAFDEFDRVKTPLAALLDVREPQGVQRASIGAIASFADPETAPMLLAGWRQGTPALRSEIVAALLEGRGRIFPLLQAIQSGVLPAVQVPFARRGTLLRSGDAAVRELAGKLFGGAALGSRKEVVAVYQAALAMKGDADRGRAVYEAACATCHRAGNLGGDVGPNLVSIRHWNPAQILANILDPNLEVAPHFLAYSVEAKDGRVIEGLISEESASSLMVKRSDGVTESILRRDIARLSSSGVSLMPEGLEAGITVGRMADLIAFLVQH